MCPLGNPRISITMDMFMQNKIPDGCEAYAIVRITECKTAAGYMFYISFLVSKKHPFYDYQLVPVALSSLEALKVPNFDIMFREYMERGENVPDEFIKEYDIFIPPIIVIDLAWKFHTLDTPIALDEYDDEAGRDIEEETDVVNIMIDKWYPPPGMIWTHMGKTVKYLCLIFYEHKAVPCWVSDVTMQNTEALDEFK